MSQSASDPYHGRVGIARGKHWLMSQKEWRTGEPRDRRAGDAATCALCGDGVKPGALVHAWSFTEWMHQGCWEKFRVEPWEITRVPDRRTVTPARYRAYIASEKWQETRRRFWASGPKPCFCCGREGGPMDLHHRTYKNLGRELLRDLVPLCRLCHDRVHRLAKAKGIELWGATNMIRRERRGLHRQAGNGRVTVRRKKTPGWIEVRALQRPHDQVIPLGDDKAASLAELLNAGPPWGRRGRIAVRQAGDLVQVVVGRGVSKPPRTLDLRGGEVSEVATRICQILAVPGLSEAG